MNPRSLRTNKKMAGFTLLPVILAMTLIAAIAFLLNRDNGINAAMVASQSDADHARYTAEAGLQAVNAIAQGKNCTGYADLGATAFGSGSFTATVSPKSGTPVNLSVTGVSADGAGATLTRSNVTMHQTTPYALTLQPGTPGQDTSINLVSPNNNYGDDTRLTVISGLVKALVQFDLSSIPAGSIIQSAQFSLYHTSGSNGTVSAFGVTRPWSEGTGVAGSGASWNSYDGINPWTTAGGDYDPAAGIAIALPANNQWANWDLTTQTAAWIAGTQPNYGIELVAGGANINTFVSSDDPTNVTLRPKLIVTFLPPCGWVLAASSVTLQASQDTWIDEAHLGSNYGATGSFTVTNANKFGRALLQFDLSGIPSKVLKSATLHLFTGSFSNPQNSILTVNPVIVPWTEGGATWKTADGTSNSWKGGGFGGNFGAPSASATISSAFTSGWVEWDITDLAQQWVDAIIPNYGAGVMIDTSSAVIFNSREFTANQPQLVITY